MHRIFKKAVFINKQEASGLLKSVRIKTLFSQVSPVDLILFQKYKVNKMINTFLLARNKFMPEMHLLQPGFTYSVCGPFTKNKERMQKFQETGVSRYIYQNELGKAYF